MQNPPQNKMFVVPSNKDVVVRDPLTMDRIPPEGKSVVPSKYWRNRERDGDIQILKHVPKPKTEKK